MSVPGWKTAARTGQWLLGRVVRHAVILGYHRVSEGPDPFDLAVSPDHFTEQLEVLARAGRILHLDQLPAKLAEGSLPKRVAIVTFDDGYADTLHVAQPLLQRLGIPATVFVVSGVLGREFWWDRLDRLSREAPDPRRQFELPINGSTFRWPTADAEVSAGGLTRALYPPLRAARHAARENALDGLARLLGAGSAPGSGDLRRALTPAELQRLADGDLVRIGAHTVTHPTLSDLDSTQQREEITGCRRDLESLLRRPVTLFSYPFGDATAGSPHLVREAGYACGCSSRNAVAWRGSDRFVLPRFWIPDWDGRRFAGWLERWLDG